MPDEALITQIENVLAEVVELGGQNERTSIVPNLTVQDADPTGLNGFVIVSDDRDGDNILAKKVGSVIYADNDLVNVMFIRGGEPIAFQQGSQSTNNGIWEIVPGTTTDIFYDKGKVGIGTATIPHGGVGWAQLALEGADFAADGPNIQFTTDVDNFPTMQIFGGGTHDEVGINFDSYYDGSWKSSNVNGNFQILKLVGRLRFRYDTGIAAGNVVTWNEGIALDDNGRTGFGTISPSAQIDSNSSSVAQLRLSHTLLDKFTNFTVDTNHHLTIDPSSTGQIKLNATVTVIDEIQHEGDADTKIGFMSDVATHTIGSLVALQMTNTTQNLIEIGDVAGTGDWDINFNNGQMFLRGSDGFLGIKTAAPTVPLEINASGTVAIFGSGASSVGLNFNGAAGTVRDMVFLSGGSARWIFRVDGTAESGGDVGSDFVITSRTDAGGGKDSVLFLERETGFVGLSVLPSTRFDLGAGAIEGDEMTDPGAGAANTYRLFAEDNGAGKTRLMVRFSSGSAVQIAIQP